jgi:hypothetical protein
MLLSNMYEAALYHTPVLQPAKPSSGGLAKPAIGSKKRQLTVPSVTMPPGGKRPTLKVQQVRLRSYGVLAVILVFLSAAVCCPA